MKALVEGKSFRYIEALGEKIWLWEDGLNVIIVAPSKMNRTEKYIAYWSKKGNNVQNLVPVYSTKKVKNRRLNNGYGLESEYEILCNKSATYMMRKAIWCLEHNTDKVMP